jgi:hypothetical protein
MAIEEIGENGNYHVGRMLNVDAEYDELSDGCEGGGVVDVRLSLARSCIGRASIKF